MELPPGILDLIKIALIALVGRGVCALLPAGRDTTDEKGELPTVWALWYVLGELLLSFGILALQLTGRGVPGMWLLAGLTMGVMVVWIVLTGPAIEERLPKPDVRPLATPRSAWADYVVYATRGLAAVGFAVVLVHDKTSPAIDALVITALILEGLAILRVHANARALVFPLILAAIAVDQGLFQLKAVDNVTRWQGGGFRFVTVVRDSWVNMTVVLFTVSALAWLRLGEGRGLTVFMLALIGLVLSPATLLGLLLLGAFCLAGRGTRNQPVREIFGRFLTIAVVLSILAYATMWVDQIRNVMNDPDMYAYPENTEGQGLQGMLAALSGGGSDMSGWVAHHRRGFPIAAILVGVFAVLLGIRTALLKRKFDAPSRTWLMVLPVVLLVLHPAAGLPLFGEMQSGPFLDYAVPAIALLGLWVLLPHESVTAVEIEPEIAD
tara:strand:+ start:5065 stop:6378 length:1314 start_codon:yes stop_codon:yes gene_type:complete